jgi:diguanylate cyclase (GGDEF)-like protein/PAS domain S-box-containing protein
MSISPLLEKALSHRGAFFCCFSDANATAVAPPAPLREWADRHLDIGETLGQLSGSNAGDAVAALAAAKRTGHATCVVSAGEPATHWAVELFNELAELRCFVAVLTQTDAPVRSPKKPEQVRNRHAAFRRGLAGEIVSIDPSCTSLLGWNQHDVIGKHSLELVHPDDHVQGMDAWAELLAQPGGQVRIRQRYLHQDGSVLWMEVTNTNRLETAEQCVVTELLDVSDEMHTQFELQRREALLARLTEALPSGVLHVHPRGEMFSNASWQRLTGGTTLASLLESINEREAVEDAIASKADLDLEVSFPEPIGSCRFARVRLRPLLEGGEDLGMLFTLDDTTAVRLQHRDLAALVERDPLTGSLNRLGIQRRVESLLAEASAQETRGAVLFLDLDNFKAVNDSFGHALGDAVLRAVSERVDHLLRPHDCIGRIGGDEFVVLLSEVQRPDDAYAVAARIERELPRLAAHFDEPVSISAAVGVAMFAPNDSFDEIMHRADRWMYARKANALRRDVTPSSPA